MKNEFAHMSIQNLKQLVAELEAENEKNWLDWFEEPIRTQIPG